VETASTTVGRTQFRSRRLRRRPGGGRLRQTARSITPGPARFGRGRFGESATRRSRSTPTAMACRTIRIPAPARSSIRPSWFPAAPGDPLPPSTVLPCDSGVPNFLLGRLHDLGRDRRVRRASGNASRFQKCVKAHEAAPAGRRSHGKAAQGDRQVREEVTRSAPCTPGGSSVGAHDL